MNYVELFRNVLPETILTVTVLVILAVHLASERRQKEGRNICSWIAALGLIGAAFTVPGFHSHTVLYGGMLVASPLSALAKIVLLGLGLIAVGMSSSSFKERNYGEYLALLLLALIGMMLLVSSDELLMIFIGLELTGLPLYALTAFRRSEPSSAEAGLKYFLFGSTASGFLLFGMSWVYGLTGSTSLAAIASHIANVAHVPPMLLCGVVLIAVGLAFKIAAAPFHFWAPDVYEAAPSPVAALVASASKVASFVLLARVMVSGFGALSGNVSLAIPGWAPFLCVLAIASIVIGNLAALVQSNLKRLLAYSAVAHSGYALVALLSLGKAGISSVIFYSMAYGLSVFGAFLVADQVERRTGSPMFAQWEGLHRRSPMQAWCLAIFMLSLAGLPPLPGFFGKFYLFTSALGFGGTPVPGLAWLVGIAFLGSLVSLYYYLVVLRVVFRNEKSETMEAAASCTCEGKIPLLVVATVVLALGVFPDILLMHIVNAVQAVF